MALNFRICINQRFFQINYLVLFLNKKNQIRWIFKDALAVKYFKIFPSYYFWHRLYDVVADIMATNYRQPQKHHIVI